MSVTRRARPFVLAAGSVPLLLALSLRGQPAPKAPAAPKPGTPAYVAQALDQIIQPRFQEDAPVFGLSRVVLINSHQSVSEFQPRDARERALMAQAKSAHRDYVVAFLHCAHVPGQVPDKIAHPAPGLSMATNPYFPQTSLTLLDFQHPTGTPPSQPPLASWQYDTIAEEPYISLRKQLLDASAAELPHLRKGKNVETATGHWAVSLRPISASKDSCLTCHAGAKRGDTLGVMVYAVSQTVNKD